MRPGNDLDDPKVPPMKEAMRIPVLRHIGKKENARDSLVSSEISAL
jgi:hypothetical protein